MAPPAPDRRPGLARRAPESGQGGRISLARRRQLGGAGVQRGPRGQQLGDPEPRWRRPGRWRAACLGPVIYGFLSSFPLHPPPPHALSLTSLAEKSSPAACRQGHWNHSRCCPDVEKNSSSIQRQRLPAGIPSTHCHASRTGLPHWEGLPHRWRRSRGGGQETGASPTGPN